MRKLKFFIQFSSLLILFSCTKAKIETITSTSPKGDKTIVINGTQKAALEPIEVLVKATVKGGSTDFTFQHQANSLTPENCKVTWFTNETGEITLTHDDGKTQVLEMHLTDDLINVWRKGERH